MNDNTVSRCDSNRRESIFYVSLTVGFLIIGSALYLAVSGLIALKLVRAEAFDASPFGVILALGLARLAANKICELAGVSLAGREIETIRRTTSMADSGLLPKPVRFCRGPVALVFPLGCTVLAGAYAFAPSALFPFHLRQMLAGTLGMAAVLGWKNLRKPAFQADGQGLSGCSLLGLSSRFVRWQDIALCERETVRDTLGKITRQRVQVKDRQGKVLARLTSVVLGEEAEAAWDQLMDFVARKLTGRSRRAE